MSDSYLPEIHVAPIFDPEGARISVIENTSLTPEQRSFLLDLIATEELEGLARRRTIEPVDF